MVMVGWVAARNAKCRKTKYILQETAIGSVKFYTKCKISVDHLRFPDVFWPNADAFFVQVSSSDNNPE